MYRYLGEMPVEDRGVKISRKKRWRRSLLICLCIRGSLLCCLCQRQRPQARSSSPTWAKRHAARSRRLMRTRAGACVRPAHPPLARAPLSLLSAPPSRSSLSPHEIARSVEATIVLKRRCAIVSVLAVALFLSLCAALGGVFYYVTVRRPPGEEGSLSPPGADVRRPHHPLRPSHPLLPPLGRMRPRCLPPRPRQRQA